MSNLLCRFQLLLGAVDISGMDVGPLTVLVFLFTTIFLTLLLLYDSSVCWHFDTPWLLLALT